MMIGSLREISPVVVQKVAIALNACNVKRK
jgi:hypothetical protein